MALSVGAAVTFWFIVNVFKLNSRETSDENLIDKQIRFIGKRSESEEGFLKK